MHALLHAASIVWMQVASKTREDCTKTSDGCIPVGVALQCANIASMHSCPSCKACIIAEPQSVLRHVAVCHPGPHSRSTAKASFIHAWLFVMPLQLLQGLPKPMRPPDALACRHEVRGQSRSYSHSCLYACPMSIGIHEQTPCSFLPSCSAPSEPPLWNSLLRGPSPVASAAVPCCYVHAACEEDVVHALRCAVQLRMRVHPRGESGGMRACSQSTVKLGCARKSTTHYAQRTILVNAHVASSVDWRELLQTAHAECYLDERNLRVNELKRIFMYTYYVCRQRSSLRWHLLSTGWYGHRLSSPQPIGEVSSW